MKFKKITVALLISLFSFNALPVQAITIKAGGICKKVGSTLEVSGKTFTCIKLGKKLIWDKGKKTVSKPIVTIPDIWPIDKPADQTIYLIADKSIRKNQAMNKESINIQVNYGPSASKARVDEYLLSMDSAAKFWSSDWRPQGNVIVAMGTALDFEWMLGYWRNYQQMGGGYDASEATYKAGGEYCNQGAATFGIGNQPFFWGCVATKGEFDNIGMKKFAAHEYTHLAQYGILGSSNRYMPNLIMEGSADFYGLSLASSAAQIQKDWETYFRMGYISEEARKYLRNASVEQISELLIDSFRNGTGNRLSKVNSHWYYTGAYVTLRMVAAKGHEGFIAFMKEVVNTSNAELAFEKVYGINFESFAKNISPEIQKLTLTLMNR